MDDVINKADLTKWMMSHTTKETKTKKIKFVEGSKPSNEKTKNWIFYFISMKQIYFLV